jgi:aminopeptidase N
MRDAADEYLSYEKKSRTPIHDTETEDLFQLLNANNYQKGSWVLHMLRSELGDKNFFSGIRSYYNEHRNSTATTEDLRAAFEKASGRNLKEFFARWIYGTGHPSYDLSWEWKSNTKTLRVLLRQLQAEAAFPNAVPIDILTPTGKRRVVLKPTGRRITKELKLSVAPTTVNMDPEHTILNEAQVTRTK